MDTKQTIDYARTLLATHGLSDDALAAANYLDFSEVVRDVVKSLTSDEVDALKDFRDFSESFRKLRDNFEAEVQSDPMVLYKPKHSVALDFHKSNALYRYFFGGNRISKTQAGAADNYWVLTHQHPFRPLAPLPASVFIVGYNFSKYAPNVFEKKYITGEGGNPLSPIFPEGGKWLHHYDDRKHIVYLCCPACAQEGKAKQCKHVKSTLVLFSDVEGSGVLAGGQYAQGQLDEQIRSEFFAEAKQRIKTVPNSGLIITETPLFGRGWWTYSELYLQGEKHFSENHVEHSKQLIVSNHTIDQFTAGLVPHDKIRADMATMNEVQIQARIYGKHVASTEMAVFDLVVLSELRKTAKVPARISLRLKGERETSTFENLLRTLDPRPNNPIQLQVKLDPMSDLHIWKKPKPLEQYIIGCDVAEGLTKRDYSCASVLRMKPIGFDIDLELVAQYHGWVNSHVYAEILYKLASWYNTGLLVVESNGPGSGCIQRLKELGCWFLFRDISDPTQAMFNLDSSLGIDTNKRSKALMISALQNAIRKWKTGRKALIIPCDETIKEMESYIQQPTQTGLSFRFGGVGDTHDDRVMSLALATYVATTFPVYNSQKYNEAQKQERIDKGETDEATEFFWKTLHAEEKLKRRENYDL